MKPEIITSLKLAPIDAAPFSDKREALESRILRIIMRSKFRSAASAPETIEFIRQHIRTQIQANQPIILIYAMGGGKGIDTYNFPGVSWAEYLHLKFLVENLYPIGEIYTPGVQINWSLDDYAARIMNNYQAEWQNKYIQDFDALLHYFNQTAAGKVKQTRIPTETWYPDFDALRERVTKDAKAKAAAPDASDTIKQWGKRAANNFYNSHNLTGDDLKQAIEFSTFLNVAWLDYDFEVRGEFFGSGIPIAHFTDFPDSLYIQTVPGSNVQFWKANGYLELKSAQWKSRVVSREAWKQIESKLTYIDNPLANELPNLDKLPILS